LNSGMVSVHIIKPSAQVLTNANNCLRKLCLYAQCAAIALAKAMVDRVGGKYASTRYIFIQRKSTMVMDGDVKRVAY